MFDVFVIMPMFLVGLYVFGYVAGYGLAYTVGYFVGSHRKKSLDGRL